MEVSIRNYTNRNTPAHAVTIGGVEFFFSYQTCIAVRVQGKLIMRENVWGSTTGRHMNEISRTAPRVPIATFQTLLSNIQIDVNFVNNIELEGKKFVSTVN